MLYLLSSMPIGKAKELGDSMFVDTAKSGTIDRMAIGLSGLCLVHCLASAIFVAMLASAGGMLLHPAIHEVGLMFAIGLGIVALGRGIVDHGFMMPSAVGGLGLGVMAGSLGLPEGGAGTIYTIIGVAILALGHDLNRRAVI
ncbi:MAG: MerC protein [Alphaproteobacteria bacterium]|nr:MerC protein [Alphaproteobacteria bacterium]